MGFYDRSYRNRPGQDSAEGMRMIWKLIGVNVAVYFLCSINPRLVQTLILSWDGIHGLHLWQFVTAGFTHVSFGHILFNMYALYFFGSFVAPHLGSVRTLLLYLVGDVAGNLLFLFFNFQNIFGLLGASGAVFAFTVAAGMLEPEKRLLLIFLPFRPIKLSTAVICFTVVEVILALTGAQGGVANLAHLGGLLGGYLMIRCIPGLRFAWDPFRAVADFFSGRKRNAGNVHEYNQSEWQPPRPPAAHGDRVPQHEIDRLLDKLSIEGVKSLTPEEEATLRRIREQMKRN